MMKRYVSPAIEVAELFDEDIILVSDIKVESTGSLEETDWDDLK